MGLAILGVIVLLYIGLAYFAAQTWQAWQAVLVVLLFLMVFFGCMLTASTLKVQKRWRDGYNTLVSRIDSETINHERLLRGSASDGELGILQMEGEARRLIGERGRVWRGLRLADLGEGQLIFDTSGWAAAGCQNLGGAVDEDEDFDDDELDEEEAQDGDAAADPAAAPAESLGLEPEAVVYAFKEVAIGNLPAERQAAILGDDTDLANRDGKKRCKVPYYYMGEFRVVANADGNPRALVVSPTMSLTENQLAKLDEEGGTWVLYEMMPADSHDAFTGLSREAIAGLLPNTGGLDRAEYDKLIAEYARDMTQGDPNDPPDRQWMTVKFTQPHSEVVDVELQDDGAESPLADAMFDPNGRSLVATLSQGATTDFEEGDEVTFDSATAQRLVDDEKAEQVDRFYVRQLRDYAHYYRSYHGSIESLTREISAAEADVAKLTAAIDQLKRHVEHGEQQQQALEFDIDGLAKERQVLTRYSELLTSKWNEVRGELSRLYRTNRSMARAQ